MYKLNRTIRLLLKILALSIFGILLAILRYIAKTPQLLESILPGQSRIYQWTRGNIFFKVSGATDAPPCVLIHDPTIGSSSYEMRHLVVQLAQRYRVYTLDLLGFGLSDHPKFMYSVDTYVALCHDFLKQVVKQPAVLIASGSSCTYCAIIADREPELCSQLILLSPQYIFTSRFKIAWLQHNVSNSLFGLALYAVLTFRPMLHFLVARQQRLAPQEIPANEVAVISAYAHQPGAQYATLASLAGRLETDTIANLKALKQPVLIIYGAKSLVDKRLAIAERYTSPTIQVIAIADAGVRAHEEVPTKVMQHILSWLDVPERKTESIPEIELKSEPIPETELKIEPEPELKPEPKTEPEPEIIENTAQIITVEAYCVKCKTKRNMQNPQRVTTKNGRSALEGICPVCGTKIFRFVATAKE